MEVRVCAVIPVLNEEQFIGKCIESLLAQTMPVEILVMEGGSTDSTKEILASFGDSIKVVDMSVNGKYHRVNWMSHEGRDKLMARLEDDMTTRMCGTPDDDSMIEPFMRALMEEEEVETEVDLDRDVPMSIVGEA